MKVTITILAFSSPLGKDLERMIRLFLPKKIISLGFECVLHNTIWNGTQYDMLKACIEDDIVIFDASIEYHNGTWDSNYEAATANAMAMDNILVVSRTRLPFNFYTMRTNVPELGLEWRDQFNNIVSTYNNKDIVEWLGKELTLMSKSIEISHNKGAKLSLRPRIPVPSSLKEVLTPGKLNLFSDELWNLLYKKMDDSIEYMKKIRTRGAFISYRSYYYKNTYHGVSACDLKEIIKKRHNDINYPVALYAEGDIAFEFMTEQRRWGVESFVDKKIRDIDEFWIFETGDEDGYEYLDSWWTCGEIISLMYMKASGCPLPRIYVYKYCKDRKKMVIEEKDIDYIPDLSKSLFKELSRYFANADGANESMGNMRTLRRKNWLVQRMAYHAMKQIQKKVFKSKQIEDEKDTNKFSDYRDSIYSHVYDESFTDNHIVFCRSEQKRLTPSSIEDFNNPQFVWNFIRTNSEMENGKFKDEIESRGYYSVTPLEMKEIIKNRQWICKENGVKIRIKEAAEPIFQWWPIRQGKRTGPNGCIIEKETNWLFDK